MSSGVVQMELIFLGTGSAVPSASRNHSCIALRLDENMWLFDVGEGSQHQIMKCPQISLGKIEKIFLTHLHGDHVFGLPGLLCTMLNASDESRPYLQIFGPAGTINYIDQVLTHTYSHLSAHYEVHELKELDQEDVSDIMINESTQSWELFDDNRCSVMACPLEHTVPTVGYVIIEKPTSGKLNMDLVRPILEANKDKLGVKNPFSLLSKIKEGQTISLIDDTVILRPEDVLGPPRPGRKVVILGDTCHSDNIIPLAQGADVIVHEATNARLKDDPKTYDEVEKTTKDHGHSTPQMAGEFAQRCGAKKLILTHFSQRYKGDNSPESLAIMEEIKALAATKFNSTILTASDMSSFMINRLD